MSNENIFQQWRGNQNILRERKTKRICYQEAYTERTAKRKSLNIKEMIKEGILEHQKGNIE